MDKVSIIVPVYNIEQYLEQCIDSIINQTYKNIEVLLIDDGSTDTTIEIIKEYIKNDNKVDKNTYTGFLYKESIFKVK